ncbi:helix-turn-helix domain-containing protein [Nocardia sp. NPDC004068]|uniref:helix-turn-helix domain-containing protein n=1 Tax=Nocardia sp. NPDC004068 TaxID=3364303 RepID=UPI0036B0ACBC
MRSVGSTLARRTLGRQLTEFRKKAEISQARAASVLGISPQTMGRLEEGVSVRSASDLYMNTLCDRYGVSDENRRTILALAREARTVARYGGGWWRPHLDRGPDDLDPRTVLDAAATQLTAWSVILLPAIVRTPDYVRAMAWTRFPNLPGDRIENYIEETTKQQRHLDDPGFSIEIFLSEAAIREEWGGPTVMAEQRKHLAEIGQRPNVSIRVMPFNSGSRIGALVGSFSLLEFPLLTQTRLTEPPIVYIEEHVGNLYLERSEEVACYKETIAELKRTALNENDSRTVILALSEDTA